MPEHRFATPCPIRLEVKLAAGHLRIVTAENDQTTVTVEGSPKLVEAITVELVGDRLVIQPRRKPFRSLLGYVDESLDVHAHVPNGSTAHIVTASAETTLDGTFAALDVTSASGNVSVTGELTGDARVRTVSGMLHLPRLAGDLTVKTVSGDIAAEAVDGCVSVKSVSGGLRVASLREGQVNVRSVSGDVELGIASGTSIDLDAVSASGDLSSEVPLSDVPGGDAGPTVVIRGNTVSGDFRVVRAA